MLPAYEDVFLLDDDEEVEEEIIPSLTYRLDEKSQTITEMIDDEEAIKQSLKTRLQTEAGEYEIYDEYYGIDLVDIIGQSPTYVLVDLETKIEEAILEDDRIKEIADYDSCFTGRNAAGVSFNAVTANGAATKVEMEVEI